MATALVSPFFLFFAGFIFSLPVHQRALIPEFVFRFFFCRTDIREDSNNHEMSRALTSDVISARLSIELPRWTPASEALASRCTSTNPFLSVVQKEERILVSNLHVYFHRAGNCNYLLSKTVLLRYIDSILLLLFKHHVDPCDS